ncbi:MAG: hypothetical protein KQH63_15090 [Desulfobulbaceae bacterium]|nr:hypothetical protein [Desulfobulbaceae bacterium]
MKDLYGIYKIKIRYFFFLICFLGGFFALQGCSSKTESVTQETAKPEKNYAHLEEEWGIRPESLRLSAAGHILDFRYKVTDPKKAVKIMHDPKLKTYLMDQASGLKLAVPSTPKIGSLRQTDMEPDAGRIYFSLFSNPNGFVKVGNKVTVVMGEFKAEDLVVE